MASITTYSQAKTEFLDDVLGNRIAYRRVGLQQTDALPLLLNIHFRGTMDHWDPLFIDTIGKARLVILFDSAGVGRSNGEIPVTFQGWANVAIELMKRLHYSAYDVFGFSMGGMAAQLIALNAPPNVVRHLILAGTSPSAGPGLQSPESGPLNDLISATGEEQSEKAFLEHFFVAERSHQHAGQDWWQRMVSARQDRSDYVDDAGAQRQLAALGHWFSTEAEALAHGSFQRLATIAMPTLIANGSNDVLVPTENSVVMWREMKESVEVSLHLYPHSGHGFLNEFAVHFARLINDFLHI